MEVKADTLPSNIEAEQALLGVLLVNNNSADRVSYLKPEHFWEPFHQRLYEGILKLTNKGQSVDPVKLKPYFENDPALDDVDGFNYVVRLATSAPTSFNPGDYGQTIYDLALKRDLIEIGEGIIKSAKENNIDVSAKDIVAKAEESLFQTTDYGPQGGSVKLSQTLKESVEGSRIARKSPNGLSGVTTGLRGLNNSLGGLHKTDLIILAGRPAMGKTALATNIALAAARTVAVDFRSPEMSRDQLGNRLLAEQTKISSERIRRGQLNNTEFREIVRAQQKLHQLPLFIDDTPGISIAALRARCRRLKRIENIGLIIVDYLQLMSGGRFSKGENRVGEIAEITRGLKNLAKELRVPVLALSQLSRKVEDRANKRPQLADLRESGTIEQDADVVMFVYRPEYYLENMKPSDTSSQEFKDWQKKIMQVAGKTEVIIGKQRHGPTGSVTLGFDKKITKFYDLNETV